MKRFLALTLATVLTIGMLTACGESSSEASNNTSSSKAETTTTTTTTAEKMNSSSKAETDLFDEKTVTEYFKKRYYELLSAFSELGLPFGDPPGFYKQEDESSGIVYCVAFGNVQYEDVKFHIALHYANTDTTDINNPTSIEVSLNDKYKKYEYKGEAITDEKEVEQLNQKYEKVAMKIALFLAEGNTNEKKIDSFYELNVKDSKAKAATMGDGMCDRNCYTINNHTYAILFWAYKKSVVQLRGDIKCYIVDGTTDSSKFKKLKESADGALVME